MMKSTFKEVLYKNPGIEIRRSSKHGWGVFARRNIKKHAIIEESPIIIAYKETIFEIPEFCRYCYDYDDDIAMFGLGYAGLYNHSSDPNIDWKKDHVNMIMEHFAIRDIEAGEELMIDYGEENIAFDIV